jgi:hypothetical protein
MSNQDEPESEQEKRTRRFREALAERDAQQIAYMRREGREPLPESQWYKAPVVNGTAAKPPKIPKRRAARDTNPPLIVTIAGVEYRVFDARIHEGIEVYANPPVRWANIRIFRPREGSMRLYQFPRGATHAIEPDTLEMQLRKSSYLPK